MGLCLNSKKTNVLAFNTEDTLLKTVEGQNLQVVEYFKYLGAWINSSEKDIRVRKALSWNVLHSMCTLWKSSINLSLKRRLFVFTVESILLYGSESWILTVQQ